MKFLSKLVFMDLKVLKVKSAKHVSGLIKTDKFKYIPFHPFKATNFF